MRLTPKTSFDDRRMEAGARAFTLIELILGIGIMAIVMIAINAVFFSAMRLRESTYASVEESLPVEHALATIRRDLQGATAPSEVNILAGTFKSGGVTSFGQGLPVEIEFYTTTGVLRDDQPWAEVQKVTYGLRPGENRLMRGQDLVRGVTRNLLATITSQAEEQWMLSGVESVQFECYDGVQWRNVWDTEVTDTNLPNAVRVRILLANQRGTGKAQSVEMLVPIGTQSQTSLSSTNSESN
jgi:type II secretion system protein J